MAAIKLVFLLALVACGSAYNSLHDDERIIGGEVAPAGLAPFAVSLRSGLLIRSHFCGGSLISTTFVVTAAHCVDSVYSSGIIGGGSLASSLQVQSGVQNLNNAGIKSTVKANYTFGMWDSYNLVYDIALLELTAALIETATLRPIALNANVVPGGEVLTAVGWGLTKYPSGSSVNELVSIKTNSLDYATCSDMRDVASGEFAGFFPLIYDDQEICTFKAVGEGMCKGDSGSALFNDDGLVGIVSWGLPCAKLAPDVFTRVSTFVPWIQGITGL